MNVYEAVKQLHVPGKSTNVDHIHALVPELSEKELQHELQRLYHEGKIILDMYGPKMEYSFVHLAPENRSDSFRGRDPFRRGFGK